MDKSIIEKIRFNLEVVLGHKAGSLPTAIGFLDQHKDSVGGHLSHYLNKRSYTKAQQYLEAVGQGKEFEEL